MIENNTLKQICIDEVHLYVIFVINFCHLFLKLRTILFDKAQTLNNNNVPTTSPTDIPPTVFKVHIIFMTVTFNIKLLNYLQQIVGFVVPNPTTFWSDASSFSCCNITIKVSTSVFKIKIIKESLLRIFKDNINKKAIVY
jgi:hypothetical protein